MNAKSNLHQAAVILKSLPQQQAAQILSKLQAPDIQQVLDAVKLVDKITADQLYESLERLQHESKRWKTSDGNRLSSPTSRQPSTVDKPHATDKPTPASDPSLGHAFDFLADSIPQIRDRVLQDEHPRNIAIVLSSLPPDVASNCLKSMEPVVRVSVIKRMCELDELNKDEINELSYALKLRHHKLSHREPYRDSGLRSATDLLSCTDPGTQENLVAMLEQSDPELASKLQHSLMSFGDLAHYSDAEVKRLLSSVDTSCWAPALKKASLAVQKKILGNMNPKPAKLLCQEMEEIGDLDERIERLARQQIIQQAVKLNR